MWPHHPHVSSVVNPLLCSTLTFLSRNEQAGVEACLILGELQMGTDALLSAILSGVLRPSAQPSEFGRAAVTVADIEEVRPQSCELLFLLLCHSS